MTSKTLPLTPEDERELARAYRDDNDARALDRLVLSQTGMVRYMARSLSRTGVPVEDLRSEGVIGLLEAAQRFDPDRGNRFATYARWWVRHYMQRYVQENRRIVRLPQTRALLRAQRRLNKARSRIEAKTGRRAEVEELADALDVTIDDVLTVLHDRSGGDMPLQDPSGNEPAYIGASPEDQAARNQRDRLAHDTLAEAWNTLDERERRILDERWFTEAPRTLQDLGVTFGVTRERVRQLEARAMKKLRAAATVMA